jgi:cytochrome c
MRKMIVFIVAALLPRLALAADGEAVFRRCTSCHSIDPQELQEMPGPNLHGVIGRRAGTLAAAEYSAAMIAAGSRGLVWSATTLDQFLAAPQSYVPDTTMTFPGISDPIERQAVIHFLARASQ